MNVSVEVSSVSYFALMVYVSDFFGDLAQYDGIIIFSFGSEGFAALGGVTSFFGAKIYYY